MFLMLDTAVDHTRKDLPVSLYETGERGERGRARAKRNWQRPNQYCSLLRWVHFTATRARTCQSASTRRVRARKGGGVRR